MDIEFDNILDDIELEYKKYEHEHNEYLKYVNQQKLILYNELEIYYFFVHIINCIMYNLMLILKIT